MQRRQFLGRGLFAAAALVAGGLTWRSFSSDLSRARARTLGRSQTIESRFGRMEYAQAGSGPPVLMVHGTGGGFDQGLDFAAPLAARWRIIAPSRFGYLRSAFPDEPSSEHQADAFVDLLDALGIERVPIIGGSAGALPALQFAIRHPDRCSAVVAMVPAAHAPGRPPVEPPDPLAQAIITHALKSDFLFWLGTSLNEDAMIRALLATDPGLVKAAGPAEQARVRAILRNILPVSARARGLLNDARLAYEPAPMPIERITAPTLALSLEDDRFQTLAAAQHIARTVPSAELAVFPTGGHVWVGREAEVFQTVDRFLSRHVR
ncbi:MAG: alpha/beta hydrolase [Caulobacteraceae bacterium]|nr:alpha/beta hydrolase [Caulobacteraceae bacterium]